MYVKDNDKYFSEAMINIWCYIDKYFSDIIATYNKTSMINTLRHNDKYSTLHGSILYVTRINNLCYIDKYFSNIIALTVTTSMINTLRHNDKYFMLYG